MKLPRRPFLVLAAASLFAAALPGVALAEDGWVQDADEKGVVVTVRSVPGRGLPIFRGVTTINASIYEILAVMDDITRYGEWMADCKAAHVIKKQTEFDRIEYNRIAAPWPVSDRDTTIHSWVEASLAKAEVWARFQSIDTPEQPPVSGVVRMPRLAGFYHLKAIDEGHTKVTYQVDADPGGLLPEWLIKLTSRKIPIETLAGLKKQVAKSRGKYDGFLKRYDPSKGGKIPPEFQK